MSTYSMFKTKSKMGDNEQVFNELKEKFGGQYEVKFNKAGAVSFLAAGQATDYTSIKKNGYHGVRVAVSPEDPNNEYYQTISITSYIPSMIINQVIGESLVARLIWGSGSEFYDSIDDFFTSKYEAVPVDLSLTNMAKQMIKGKSVVDD